jgi:hypothetical protein
MPEKRIHFYFYKMSNINFISFNSMLDACNMKKVVPTVNEFVTKVEIVNHNYSILTIQNTNTL